MNFQLINTEETISRILSLIREARERVTLISPYITLGAGDRLGRAVREALSRKVRVSIVVRQDEQTPLKDAWLEAMRPHIEAGLQLHSVPGLHAKLYRSESTVLITSLNLLGSSFLNTIEVGLWSQEAHALREVDAFIKREVAPHASLVVLDAKGRLASTPKKHEQRVRSKPAPREEKEGCCIRCGDDIPFDPERPYCWDCYTEWAEWENEDYEDDFCHACGDDYPATMARPLCRDCFRQSA
ncbi:phospholipase D-like domain-containing protein [Archangium violaceum]|uniref:phospholipase D-like domain-containing protein n=1 Tax=Archangium violaceum TaxID=83451 RepID=UPI0036DF31DB